MMKQQNKQQQIKYYLQKGIPQEEVDRRVKAIIMQKIQMNQIIVDQQLACAEKHEDIKPNIYQRSMTRQSHQEPLISTQFGRCLQSRNTVHSSLMVEHLNTTESTQQQLPNDNTSIHNIYNNTNNDSNQLLIQQLRNDKHSLQLDNEQLKQKVEQLMEQVKSVGQGNNELGLQKLKQKIREQQTVESIQIQEIMKQSEQIRQLNQQIDQLSKDKQEYQSQLDNVSSNVECQKQKWEVELQETRLKVQQQQQQIGVLSQQLQEQQVVTTNAQQIQQERDSYNSKEMYYRQLIQQLQQQLQSQQLLFNKQQQQQQQQKKKDDKQIQTVSEIKVEQEIQVDIGKSKGQQDKQVQTKSVKEEGVLQEKEDNNVLRQANDQNMSQNDHLESLQKELNMLKQQKEKQNETIQGLVKDKTRLEKQVEDLRKSDNQPNSNHHHQQYYTSNHYNSNRCVGYQRSIDSNESVQSESRFEGVRHSLQPNVFRKQQKYDFETWKLRNSQEIQRSVSQTQQLQK